MIHITEPAEVEVLEPTTVCINDMHEKKEAELTLFTATVKARHSNNVGWTEIVDVTNVSHCGAGFYIRRDCQAGQLLSMILPMPTDFRRFERDKKLYRIWGLVQHCSTVEHKGEAFYHIGLAFTGPRAPSNYEDNPSLTYRVCGITEQGFWQIEPIDAQLQSRREPRFWKSIDVSIYELNQFDATVRNEKTSTENISESGASVISFLNVNVGDRVRVQSQKYDFSAYALVRNRQSGSDEKPRLHLEFVDQQFPVSDLEHAAEY